MIYVTIKSKKLILKKRALGDLFVIPVCASNRIKNLSS